MKPLTTRLNRSAGWLSIAGGLLWILYAIWETLQPMGSAVTVAPDTGHIAITHPGLFRMTGAAGGTAVVMLGLAVVGVATRYGLPGDAPDRFSAVLPSRYGVAMAWVGALAGLVATVMALLTLALPNNAMQIFGALLVPFSAMLVAVEANGSEHAYRIAAPLFLVGALGMAALLVQALLPFVPWMLPVYAALAMAVYGFAWVRFGSLLLVRER
jgi:hypothetical protein